MPRIKQLNIDETSSYTNKLYKKVEESLGRVPNIFKCMGNSEMALDSFLSMNANFMAGKLGGKFIRMIMLSISEVNGCEYCVAAQIQMAKNASLLNDEECLNARRFIGTDDKSQAMLDFIKKVHETKGMVKDEDIEAVRNAGFGDVEIVEILGTVALITFANYIGNVGVPELDFPEVPKIT